MAKNKSFTVTIDPDEVVYTNISTSKEGYNYARIVTKKAENEYLSISYEWESKNIPGFVMDLMGFMKSNMVENANVWPGREEDYEEFSKESSEECPGCSKKKEDCACKE